MKVERMQLRLEGTVDLKKYADPVYIIQRCWKPGRLGIFS